jgi:trafficking kinesin-binding protein 1
MFRKIAMLEEENRTLRSDIHEVVAQTDETEEQERRIMDDLNKQLGETNQQLDSLNLELDRYKEENRLQYEEIVSLTKRCQQAEMRLHQITTENDETTSMLCITKENQDLLAQELAEFKSRYAETCALLQETQELLKRHVKKTQPSVRSSLIPGGFTNHFNSSFSYVNDSLHSELLDSLDSGILSDPGSASKSYRAVNDTMKFVQNSATRDERTPTDVMSQLDSSSAILSASAGQTRMSSYYAQPPPYAMHDSTSFYSTIYGAPVSVKMTHEGDTNEETARKMGDMGTPGARDLEEALKRLTPAEILSRRAMLSYSPAGTYSYDDPPLCRTPESIMSTLSSVSTTTRWQMPKKLEIVKPMEGSMTLNQWKGLATPTFGGLLQDNAHVKVRGERKLEELGVHVYSLSDLEEDPDEHPGKQFNYSQCIYTFTNSTVMHPDDGTSSVTFSLPPSQMSSRMHSNAASRQPT